MKEKTTRLFAITAFAFYSLVAMCQLPQHEIRFGIGIGYDRHAKSILDQYVEAYGLERNPWGGDLTCSEFSAHAEYLYHFHKHWAIGGTFGAAGADTWARQPWDEKYKASLEYSPFDFVFGGIIYTLVPSSDVDIKSRSYYAIPSVMYTWYDRRTFRLYSKAGLGIQYYRLDVTSDHHLYPEKHEDRWKLAYQVSCVGVETGGERMRGFVEIGYGKQGILNLGLILNL